MSPLFSLLLGHLIGDFSLQTIDLVRYKTHSWRGMLIHSGLVTASCAVCLWGNLLTWWPWLVPLFALHWLTDWAKVALNRHISGWKVRSFFLDQALHVAVIVGLVAIQAGGWPYASLAEAVGAGPANRALVFVMAWIIAVFVAPLLEAQAAYALTRFTSNEAGYGNGISAGIADRLWGGAERTLVLLLLYIGSPVCWLAPLAFVPRLVALCPVRKVPRTARMYMVRIATSVASAALLGAALLWMEPHL